MFEYYLCYVFCIAFALSSSFDVILHFIPIMTHVYIPNKYK